jgi:hypothetical protein
VRNTRIAAALLATALFAAVPGSARAADDTTPPVVKIHRGLIFTVGSQLSDATFGAHLPVRATWTVTDENVIVRQIVNWESYTAGSELVASGNSTILDLRSTSFPYFAEGSARVLVDADDPSDNRGEDVAGYYGEMVQTDDTRFARSPDWTPVPCRLCYSNRATLRTTTFGASMNYTFRGQAIALIGGYSFLGGQFKVLIDGVQSGPIRSEHGNPKKMAVVYQHRWNTNATRTITIVAQNGRVDMDALVVQVGSA